MDLKCAMINLPEASDRAWVDYAVSCGLGYIEFCPRYYPQGTEDSIQYALEKGLQVSIHAHHGPNNIIDTNIENRIRSVEQIKYCIDLAQKYQLGVVTFHPGRLSSEEESTDEKWIQLMNAVTDIAAYAKNKQVYVGLENMELRKYELVFTIDDLNRFAHLAENNPYFGVTIDFAHFTSHGIFAPDLNSLKLPVYNVHLSQCIAGKMHCPLTAPGGVVRVEDAYTILNRYGYNGRIVFEMRSEYRESMELLRKIQQSQEK